MYGLQKNHWWICSTAGAVNGKGKKKRKRDKEDGFLFNVQWHRVVLDEGQMIKNARTKVAQATWRLKATHRCVSDLEYRSAAMYSTTFSTIVGWIQGSTICRRANTAPIFTGVQISRLQCFKSLRHIEIHCVKTM